MTKVKAVQCSKCNCIVFSRALHDYRTCPCGITSIDGGFDYVKVGFAADADPPKVLELEVKQTPMELYEDWCSGRNEYGLIVMGAK